MFRIKRAAAPRMKRGGPQRGRLLATAGSPSSSLVFDTPRRLWNIYPPRSFTDGSGAVAVPLFAAAGCRCSRAAGTGRFLAGSSSPAPGVLLIFHLVCLAAPHTSWQDVSPASVISFKSFCSVYFSIFIQSRDLPTLFLLSAACSWEGVVLHRATPARHME